MDIVPIIKVIDAYFCNKFKILASYELQGRRRSGRARAGVYCVNTHMQKSSGVNMSNMTKYGSDCTASLLREPRRQASERERCQHAFAPKFGLERASLPKVGRKRA